LRLVYLLRADTSVFIVVHVQKQQEDVRTIQARLPDMSHCLSLVSSAENECLAANVEENDYTVFTCQDLEFELELVTQSIAKKISFIDNQVLSFLTVAAYSVNNNPGDKNRSL